MRTYWYFGETAPLFGSFAAAFTLVTMTQEGPTIANLRLDGILNKYGKIPLGGDSLCFQASRCK